MQQEHLVFREQLERVVLRGRMDRWAPQVQAEHLVQLVPRGLLAPKVQQEPQVQREPQAKAYRPEEPLDKSWPRTLGRILIRSG